MTYPWVTGDVLTAPDLDAAFAARLPLTGGTLTGALTLFGPPTSPLHAATKTYVDAADAALAAGGVSVTATGTTTARTLPARFADTRNVKDFGALGDGVTDDTAAINAAVAALGSGGGVVFFPPGVYVTSSTITISANAVRLQGSGGSGLAIGTMLKSTSTTTNILTFTGANCGLADIGLTYATTPSAGAAISCSGGNSRFSRFIISNCWDGFEFTAGTAQFADHFQITTYANRGIYIHATNDIYLDSFILNAGNATNGANGGIRLQDKCEAIVVSNADILQGVNSIVTDAAAYGIGTRPAYCKFSNVYFDSANLNCGKFNNAVVFSFTNCWFSGGRAGAGQAGMTLLVTDSFTFVNTNFINCGSHGANLTVNAIRTVFEGCTFESNSITAGVGVAHGLSIAPNVTDFVVHGCIAHNGILSGQQGWGILVNTGTSDRYVISDNLLTGNVTGTVSDGGSGVSKRVENAGTMSSSLTVGGSLTVNGTGTSLTVAHAMSVAGLATLSGGFTGNGVGGVLSGANAFLQVGNGGVRTYSGAASGAQASIMSEEILRGTVASGLQAVNYLWVPDDGAVGPTSNGQIATLQILHTCSANAVGNRWGVDIALANSAITAAGVVSLGGIRAQSLPAFNMGGTGVALGTSQGVSFGGNITALAQGTATNLRTVTGLEIDVGITSGASAYSKEGLKIVLLSNDATQGAVIDYGLSIQSQVAQASGVGFKTGIVFGGNGGFGVAATGTLMGAQAGVGGMTAALGIDFSGITFSETPIKVPVLTNAANDAAAAGAGISVGGFYRNGSVVMQRVV